MTNQAQALREPSSPLSFNSKLIKVDFRTREVNINPAEVDINPTRHTSQRRTTSLYKSNGQPKATAAEPIRNPEDIKKVQDYFLSHDQLRNYTIFTVGLIFGLRAGDLLSLRIHHVLKPDGSFKSHCDLIESKTRKFNNPVITPAVKKLLSDYLAMRSDYTLDDPLFPSRKANKDGEFLIDITSFNRILNKVSKELNIPHISSHSLRKTFVYQLLKQNPNDDTVKFACQQMLNHDSFKTTLTYCGLTQDAMDTYRSGLEEVFV